MHVSEPRLWRVDGSLDCGPCKVVPCFPSRWPKGHIKIARMTLTIKLDRNWNSFQLANSAPPLSVTDSAIAPSARMRETCSVALFACALQPHTTGAAAGLAAHSRTGAWPTALQTRAESFVTRRHTHREFRSPLFSVGRIVQVLVGGALLARGGSQVDGRGWSICRIRWPCGAHPLCASGATYFIFTFARGKSYHFCPWRR